MDHLELGLDVRRGRLRVRMAINGDAGGDVPNLEVSPAALEQSATAPGRHFIINCTCGDPGCGAVAGVDVSHTGEEIVWAGEDVVPRGRSPLRFAAAIYRQTVARLCDELRARRRAEPKLTLACDDGFG